MRLILTAAAGLVAALAAGQAHAVTAFTLTFGENSISSNSPSSGASGTALMTFSESATSGQALLEVLISNTTGTLAGPGGTTATTSKLTAFGFDLLEGATYVADSFVAGDHFKEALVDESFAPFGTLDLAAADDENLLGGSPTDALPQGDTDSVSFELAYTPTYGSADALGLAFFDFLANDPGPFTGDDANARSGMRFQSVDGSGSDKLVSPDVSIIPVPAGVLLIGSAFLVAGAVSARARRKAA